MLKWGFTKSQTIQLLSNVQWKGVTVTQDPAKKHCCLFFIANVFIRTQHFIDAIVICATNKHVNKNNLVNDHLWNDIKGYGELSIWPDNEYMNVFFSFLWDVYAQICYFTNKIMDDFYQAHFSHVNGTFSSYILSIVSCYSILLIEIMSKTHSDLTFYCFADNNNMMYRYIPYIVYIVDK